MTGERLRYFVRLEWIVTATFSCVPPSSAFYVQDSARLKSVTIVECSEVTFRDLDYGNKAKRQACTKRTLNGAQRRVFEKHRGEVYDVNLVPVVGLDEPDEGP